MWATWIGDKTATSGQPDAPAPPSLDGLVLEPGTSGTPDVFAHGIERDRFQIAARLDTAGTIDWAIYLGQGDYPDSESTEYYPRKRLMAVDASNDAYYLATEIEGSGSRGRDVWIARVNATNGGVDWEAEIHLSAQDGDDFVGGVTAHGGHVLVGGYSAAADGTARVFVSAYNANTGVKTDEAMGPVMSVPQDVRDVALDPSIGRFYLAGMGLSEDGAGIAVGFDVSDPDDISLDYNDPFAPALFIGPEVDSIVIDGRGDLYIGGVATVTGPEPKMFVARHDLSDVIGRTYVTPFTGIASSSPEFGHLAVNSGGLAYVTGTAIKVDTGGRDVVTWRIDPTGDVRWATIVECPGDFQWSHALAIREVDQSIFVGASLESPGGWCVEDPRFVGPCTNILQLNLSGEIIGAQIPQPDANQLIRRPRLLAATEGERVYSASVVLRPELEMQDVYKLFVEAYDFPLASIVTVGADVHEPAEIRATTQVTGTGFRVTLDGLDGAGADVRVFDVAGRLAARATLAPEASAFEVAGASTGVYFIEALASDGRRAQLKTVVFR